jgi:hypothetical protein
MEKEETRDRTQHGDRDRRGYMGESHHTDDRGIGDGTALPQTDSALTGIHTENPNVNDTDVGDSRLVDPGKSKHDE